MFDAIASMEPMEIAADGTFGFDGEMPSGEYVKVDGKLSGGSAGGTVTLTRGDTNYSSGQMYFGTCSGFDVPWTASAG